jgi:hypothetical protein
MTAAQAALPARQEPPEAAGTRAQAEQAGPAGRAEPVEPAERAERAGPTGQAEPQGLRDQPETAAQRALRAPLVPRARAARLAHPGLLGQQEHPAQARSEDLAEAAREVLFLAPVAMTLSSESTRPHSAPESPRHCTTISRPVFAQALASISVRTTSARASKRPRSALSVSRTARWGVEWNISTARITYRGFARQKSREKNPRPQNFPNATFHPCFSTQSSKSRHPSFRNGIFERARFRL